MLTLKRDNVNSGIISNGAVDMIKNNLRVWGVWSRACGKILFVDADRNNCSAVVKRQKSIIPDLEILRFDLSPLYYDTDSSARACQVVSNTNKKG